MAVPLCEQHCVNSRLSAAMPTGQGAKVRRVTAVRFNQGKSGGSGQSFLCVGPKKIGRAIRTESVPRENPPVKVVQSSNMFLGGFIQLEDHPSSALLYYIKIIIVFLLLIDIRLYISNYILPGILIFRHQTNVSLFVSFVSSIKTNH